MILEGKPKKWMVRIIGLCMVNSNTGFTFMKMWGPSLDGSTRFGKNESAQWSRFTVWKCLPVTQKQFFISGFKVNRNVG